MPVDTVAYFSRIGLPHSTHPDIDLLRSIHWAHLQTVPFENLDIRPLGLPVSLELDAIEEKIVHRRRGGFCYELNGLLAEILRQLEYEVIRVSARFLLEDGQYTPAFDHMALLVRTDDSPKRWLVDVGCARSSPAYPLPLEDGLEETHAETGNSYRVVRADSEWELDMKERDGEWKVQYRFEETAHDLSAFTDRCRFQWSDPESHFTRGALCSRNVYGGRITLTDSSLIRTRDSSRIEEPISTLEEFQTALFDHFGIVLPSNGT